MRKRLDCFARNDESACGEPGLATCMTRHCEERSDEGIHPLALNKCAYDGTHLTTRHCEERTDEAMHSSCVRLDCFASLAMTISARSPSRAVGSWRWRRQP